jgi:hypothetical protein
MDCSPLSESELRMPDVDLHGMLRSKAANFIRKNPKTTLAEFCMYLLECTIDSNRKLRTIDDSGRTDGEGPVIFDGAPEGYPLAIYLEIVRADLKTVLGS